MKKPPLALAAWLVVACGEKAATEDPHAPQRAEMVATRIASSGVTDERVLAAMRKVPRHRFVPAEMAAHAYQDMPLPIGYGQTISQPFVVAFMTAALELKGTEKVLEIGTGSGYQTAVFAELAKEVYSIEIVKPLGERAAEALASAGYQNVRTRIGDGCRGWPEAAPFDAIMVTCAPDDVPQPLVDQLVEGGRMIIPVGDVLLENSPAASGVDALLITDSTVAGRVRAENNSGRLRIAASQLTGNLAFLENRRGSYLIRGNFVGGNIRYLGNRGAGVIAVNDVGGDLISHENSPAPRIANNDVDGDIVVR